MAKGDGSNKKYPYVVQTLINIDITNVLSFSSTYRQYNSTYRTCVVYKPTAFMHSEPVNAIYYTRFDLSAIIAKSVHSCTTPRGCLIIDEKTEYDIIEKEQTK
jgi:hypothetical protein